MLKLFWMVLCGCLCLSLAAAEPETLADAAKKLPEKLENKPLAFLPLLADAPKELKGDLSDPAWAKAAQLKFSVNHTGEAADVATQARVFCTAEALYIGLQCDDPDTDNLKTAGSIWDHDAVEIFLYAGHDLRGKLYHQIILDCENKTNANRTHVYPKNKGRSLSEAWSPKLEHATAKTKTCWTAELKVRFADLNLTPEAISKETLWRMALYRTRPSRGEEEAREYAWSPTMSREYHAAGRFGYILPESHASAKLLANIVQRAATAQPQPKAAPVEDVNAELRKLVVKLGDDLFEERNRASERIAELAKQHAAYHAAIDDLLRQSEKDSDTPR
jgi:hypothetical protein